MIASPDSPLPQSRRLFFALWPDEHVVQQINQQVIQHFTACHGRILQPQYWHITLAYFGAANEETQACLEKQAAKIISQSFELYLSICGFWPRPKVAWLAPEESPEALKRLALDLQHEMTACGFKPEKRDYQPHITLVRKATQPPSVNVIAGIRMKVSSFCLAESITRSHGAEYKVLKRWDL